METDQDNGTNISNTRAEGKATERTQKQAKDTHETEMESSLTQAHEGGDTDANEKPADFITIQGDDTPDNILSADAASNKDTEQGAEEDTSEQTQKQGETLDSSVTPAKQEGDTVADGEATKITPHQGADTAAEKTSAERTLKQTKRTHETEKESSATPAKEDGDTDAKGEPTIFKPNRGDGTPDNKLSADVASNEGEVTTENEMGSSLANAKEDVVAKGEPTELPPNQGGGADAEENSAEITPKQYIVPNEETTDLTLNQGKSGKRTSKQEENITENETEFSVTQAKDERDTDANRKPTEFTPNQGETLDSSVTPAKQEKDTHETEKESSATPAKEDGDTDAKGEPTIFKPNRGDGTPDNRLTADVASNEGEVTTENEMGSSLANAKEDVVAKGEPTELPPNQGGGGDAEENSAEITRKQDIVPNEEPKDLTLNQGKSGKRTSKQEGDTDANRKPTEFTPNQSADTSADEDTTDRTQTQGAETDANDKCADRTQKKSRNEKGGEPTEPSKGVNSSKCLGESPQVEDKNPDSTLTIQDVIDTNEALLSEIVQLKQEMEVMAKDRDGKEKGLTEYCLKDIDNQTTIMELREKIKALNVNYEEAVKNTNVKINDIVKENNKYKKKDADNEKYKKSLHEHIKDKNKEIAKQYEEITKQKEEIKKLKGTIKKVETKTQEYEKESKLEIRSLKSNIATLKEIETKQETVVSDLIRDFNSERQNYSALRRKYNDLLQKLHASQGEVQSVTEEKKELLLRLSKVAGANLTYNNPNIADLSDEKRPTKLAEEFSELYDNEWTDVFEELDFETEKGKTNYMLDILMKTNAICSDLSNGHTKRIKDAFCRLTSTSHNTLANVVKQSRLETMEVVPTDQKEAKVESVDKDMDLVKEGNNVNNESHDDDEQIDKALKNKFELEETEEKQDKTDSCKVTESIEMSVQSRENNLEQDESTAGYSNTINAGKKEGNHDNNDEKSELEHSNTEGNPKENEDVTGVETPEAPVDESIEGLLSTVNADQNKCKANKYKKDEIPEAKHDSKDKGHEEKEEEKTEPPKDERTAVYSNMLSNDKNESKANKDKNYEKSKFEQNNMDDNPEGNKEETEVKTSEHTITTEEAHHAGTDKETEKRIEGNALQPKQDAANENANEFQSNGTSGQQHDNTDKPPVANQVATPESPIKDKTDSDAMEAPEATHSSMDDVTETTTAIRIESDFELLQKEQKKTIMDAKNFFENQLAKEVETTVADIIGKAFHADSEKTTLKTYIQKCVNICWSMYRHNPPVFIEFPELKESTPFDTNKYKPYTSSGKFIDYIVWPALYLHENGPLLCKGVAQGLGNKKSK